MPDIQLRPARWSDLPAVGHVAEQAFFEDNLLGDLIHPYRRDYPGDMSLYWTRRARVHFWDYRWKQVVAVDKDQDGNDKVVGFIQCTYFLVTSGSTLGSSAGSMTVRPCFFSGG